MAIRIQEQLFGFGYKSQVAALTPNSTADLWRLSKLNTDIAFPELATENDAAEMGKGDEFATIEYETSWTTKGTMKKYLSSQFAQWLFSFGLGGITASNQYTSTIIPQDPQQVGIELPYFSVLQQFRPSQPGGYAMDQMIIGCAIEEWSIDINSGPGRQASMATVNFIGMGKFSEPSGLTMPALTPEVLLPAASATVTINGIDYVATKNLLSLKITGKNNLNERQGFFIGSGTQNGAGTGAVRGRLEFQNRQYGLSFVTRLRKTSDEFAKLQSLTTGSAVVTLNGGASDTLSITYPKVAYSSMTLQETDTLATLSIDCTCIKDPINGVLSVQAQNSTIAGIGSAG